MQPIPIVSDSGPILSFARADQFDLLRAVTQELIVPQAVWDEIVVQGRGRPASRSVEKANWIRLQLLSNPETAERLSERLHQGEREAIALAVELQAALLVDDFLARETARRLKIDYFGSLRILKEAKERGVIEKVRPVLDQLVTAGMYMSEALYQDFLNKMGETK